MPRTIRNPKMDTRSARAKLPARKSVYWTSITPGCALGYRQGAKGGRWVAKFVRKGKRHESTLGPADDVMDPDGIAALSFAQAQEKAREWFSQVARRAAGKPDVTGPYTLAEAVQDYLNWFRAHRKGLRDTEYSLKGYILPEFGPLELSELTAERLREWHRKLAETAPRLRTSKGRPQQYRDTTHDPEAERKRRATANRILTILKAVLNHAWREGKVESDDVWRRVKPFPSVDTARIRNLDQAECIRLVNACTPDFRDLVRAALASGCRYGELIALEVSDFHSASGTAVIRASKSGKDRHVVLSNEGRTFFEELTAGRAGHETLLRRNDGSPWRKAHQHRRIDEACERAGISPPISFHILRHTYASLLLMNGASLQVIALNLGHADTRMVEKHYGHLAPSYVADMIRATAPELGVGSISNVSVLTPRKA